MRQATRHRRVFRSGNSLVLALPKDVLDQLGLGEGAALAVQVDYERGRIILTPATSQLAGIDPDFARRVDGFVARYRPALESLARK